MLKFPADRVYHRPRRWRRPRNFLVLVLLCCTLFASWYFDIPIDPIETIPTSGLIIKAADGDSFVIGNRKLRLKGIDAPEYDQNCKDAANRDWPCGRRAKAALEKLLAEPMLSCETTARDRYGRNLVSCHTTATTDMSAAQVRAGMAVSAEFHSNRNYGAEEDAARAAKRGIWQGQFVRPKDHRAGKKPL
jgi:endonuclease YncB( thermonuclease family)